MQGFCAETAGAITLFGATYLGIPVSTTHTITGAIVGVGVSRRASAVRWGIARGIVIARIVTIPASALVAAIAYWLAASYMQNRERRATPYGNRSTTGSSCARFIHPSCSAP